MSHTSGEVRHVDGNITDRGNQNDILEKKNYPRATLSSGN